MGGVNTKFFNEQNLHKQFIDFGIDEAVQQLIHREKKQKVYIGCSVGGVIIYKAGLIGLPIEKLIAISSTRIRKEIIKPNFPHELYYGISDPYKPDPNWIKTMGISTTLIDGDHGIYKQKEKVQKILSEFI